MNAPGEGNQGATVRLHLQTACISFANGDYSAATAELSRLLELDPTNPAALALKAEIAANREDPESQPRDSEFTRWFSAHGQAAEPHGGTTASPMPGSAPEPAAVERPRGEFTEWWELHNQETSKAGSAQPRQTPAPSTAPPAVSGVENPRNIGDALAAPAESGKMADVEPPQVKRPPVEPQRGPGESTSIIRVAPNKFRVVPLARPAGASESTPAAPESARPAAADPPVSNPSSWSAGPEPFRAGEPTGEFTRFFRSPNEGALYRKREPEPSIQSAPEIGEFTPPEGGPLRPVPPPIAPPVSPGIRGPEPSDRGEPTGEVTRFFRPPNESAFCREPEPELPGPTAPEAGEFTRIFRDSEPEGGPVRPVQPQVAVPARGLQPEPPAQDPSDPGDFTRIIRGSDSPSRLAPPARAAIPRQPAPAPQPPSGPGEYTRVVGSRAVAPPPEPQVATPAPAATGSGPPRPRPFFTPIRLVVIFSVLAALALILIVFFAVSN